MPKTLTKTQHQRLLPFLHRKSARQQVRIVLLAYGYTVPALIQMQVADLRALCLPVDIAVLVDQILEDRKSGPAFQYPNGTPIPHTEYYRLISNTAKKKNVLGRPMSVQQFQVWIKQKK